MTVPKPKGLVYTDGTEYHGASLYAFYCLARRYGYTMVYCERTRVNCFWVRNDLLEIFLREKAYVVQQILIPSVLNLALWKHPNKKPTQIWHEIDECLWLWYLFYSLLFFINAFVGYCTGLNPNKWDLLVTKEFYNFKFRKDLDFVSFSKRAWYTERLLT